MTASGERQRRALVAHETQHLALGISAANAQLVWSDAQLDQIVETVVGPRDDVDEHDPHPGHARQATSRDDEIGGTIVAIDGADDSLAGSHEPIVLRLRRRRDEGWTPLGRRTSPRPGVRERCSGSRPFSASPSAPGRSAARENVSLS